MSRTRHTPKVVIKRGGDIAIPMHGEPACSTPEKPVVGGPGSTTIVDVYVNCEACLKLLARQS